MINQQKKEQKAYIRFILFMLRRMSAHKLARALEAVKDIYENA